MVEDEETYCAKKVFVYAKEFQCQLIRPHSEMDFNVPLEVMQRNA